MAVSTFFLLLKLPESCFDSGIKTLFCHYGGREMWWIEKSRWALSFSDAWEPYRGDKENPFAVQNGIGKRWEGGCKSFSG